MAITTFGAVNSGNIWLNETTTNPTVNDDTTANYIVGSRWVNTTNGKVFICRDNSTGAAIWEEINGERGMQGVAFDFTDSITVGDGAYYFRIDSRLAGMNLVDVHAEVITAGTTGTTDIQIANVTQATDMLTTKLTIDSGETGSDTAATPAVIDTANDDVAENDVLRVDVDAVSTTAPQGLIITLGFRTP